VSTVRPGRTTGARTSPPARPTSERHSVKTLITDEGPAAAGESARSAGTFEPQSCASTIGRFTVFDERSWARYSRGMRADIPAHSFSPNVNSVDVSPH